MLIPILHYTKLYSFYRVLLSQTESLDKPSEDVYATSPPSSSFIMGETLTLSESKDINQPTSPGKNGRQYRMYLKL